ncbi:MAG: GLUG motif-containing protein, partial [Lachnospiraceae bacterium]|nr:GLUG motif-containing protein [Lachnospiraceae bacterium]
EISPSGSQNQVGGIVGVNYGSIENCKFSGNVIGDNEVGGIAGVNEETGEIRRCESNANVIGNHSAGGIVGNNHGILNNCSNSGSINTYSTEVTYDLDDITMDNLEQINSTSNVAAHTDTGGIAGISDGKIYYCSNSGAIGYQHVGYNTGGIVGRLHQGYLQNCTNTGFVQGRKDVGGIVGQMEPFLEIQYLSDKLKELDTETDKFLDMLDATQKDLSNYSRQASTLTKSISTNLKDANSAGNSLTGTTNDLWYIYNQELNGVSNDLKVLNNDLNKQAEDDKNNGNRHDITLSGNDLSGGDITITVPDDTESYKTALKKFGENATKHLDNMTNASTDRSGGIKNNLDTLNQSLDKAFDQLGQLGDVLQAGLDNTDAHVDELMDQARVLRRLVSEIRDDLFRYEGISVEDTSDESASKGEVNPGDPDAEAGEAEPERTEEALYDTSSFQKGKVTLCVNRGVLEADTNVGGIVGQVATEYDFDPEDDITLTGTESFDVEQTIKAVIRDSRNYADVTGKKDYVGGIVGKAEYGAVISCESYAPIESTGGSYVGGVAGSASYAIRSCYSMGKITGKNNIGGIAGEGCDIFYSYAYNELDMSGESQGSIAGKVKDDGTLYGNYYVEGGAGGVDGIGYQGGATPLSYQEFCNKDGVPEAFSQFTITFQADGVEVASYKCNYGDYLSADQIPKVPEKEGYYGVWPDYDFSYITGNRVLEAEYQEWIASIASAEKNDANKPLVMAEGNFYPNAALHLQIEGDTYKVSMTNSMKEDAPDYTGEASLRVYCEDADNTVVWVDQDGEYREVESTVIGSYRQFTMEVPGSFRIAEAEGSHTRMIVIGIIGVAVGILLIVLLVKKMAKRRKKRRQEKRDKKTQKASGSADSDRTEDNAAENTETAEHAGQMDDTEGQL